MECNMCLKELPNGYLVPDDVIIFEDKKATTGCYYVCRQCWDKVMQNNQFFRDFLKESLC